MSPHPPSPLFLAHPTSHPFPRFCPATPCQSNSPFIAVTNFSSCKILGTHWPKHNSFPNSLLSRLFLRSSNSFILFHPVVSLVHPRLQLALVPVRITSFVLIQSYPGLIRPNQTAGQDVTTYSTIPLGARSLHPVTAFSLEIPKPDGGHRLTTHSNF